MSKAKKPQSSTSAKGGSNHSTLVHSVDSSEIQPQSIDNADPYFAKKLPEHLMKDDPSLNWFQKPHTVTVMIIALIVLIFGAFTRDKADTVSNVKLGLGAGAGTFLVFSVLYLHDGPFRRPHPAVWRVVTGIAVLYLCSLVYLLFQTVDDVRQFLKYFDPKLGVPLPERSYAEHCELYTPDNPHSQFKNLMDTLNDEFVLAHIIGWFAKTLLLRDAYLCVFLSVLFEIWEITLQHQLPNFAECWWDHILLDILICNNLGIIVGLITCRYLLRVKEFNWTGLWATKQGKLVRAFLPTVFDEYRWEIFSNARRFISVILLIIGVSIIELNAFYLKYILWVPPPHPLNIIRLFLWLFMGLPALREYYQFVSDPTCHKLGTMTWLCTCIFTTEALICIKFGYGMFPNPAPPEVFWPWVIFLVTGTIASVVYFMWKDNREKRGKSKQGKRQKKKKAAGNNNNNHNHHNNNNSENNNNNNNHHNHNHNHNGHSNHSHKSENEE